MATIRGIVRVAIAERRDGTWVASIPGSANPLHYADAETRAGALEKLRQRLQSAEGERLASVDEVVLRLDAPVEGS